MSYQWKSYDIDTLAPLTGDANYTLTSAIKALLDFTGTLEKGEDWIGTELSFHDGSDFCTYTYTPPVNIATITREGLKTEKHWILTGGTKYIKDFNARFTKLDDEFNKYIISSSKFYAVEWNGQLDTSLARGKERTPGDIEFLDSLWSFYLIDKTRVPNNSKVVRPLGKLRKGNLLRFKDGSFAPVVQVSQERWNTCVNNALYTKRDLSAGSLYCIAGGYNAVKAFKDFRGKQDQSLFYQPRSGEVAELRYWDLVKPWETVDSKYSVVLVNERPFWFLDNVLPNRGKGNSVDQQQSNMWTGIFSAPGEWDGIKIGNYGIPISSITLGKCSLSYRADGNKEPGLAGRFSYIGSRGTEGQGIVPDSRKTALYPCHKNVVDLIDEARSGNPGSYEAQYQLWSAYICCQEMKFGTKYLNSRDKFTSGISSVGSCRNEAEYRTNGGVKIKKGGTTTYAPWNAQVGGTGKTGDELYNSGGPKEMCLESQLALSYAAELSINPETTYRFYSCDYRYSVPANIGGASLRSGQLNAILYTETPEIQHQESGATFQFNLRIPVCGGLSLGADSEIYLGGTEYVISPETEENDTGDTSIVQKVRVYQCKDLKDLTRTDADTEGTINATSKFSFQDTYQWNSSTNIERRSSWVRYRFPYSGLNSMPGGTDTTGEGIYYDFGRNIPNDDTKRVRLQATYSGPSTTGKPGIRNVYLREWNSSKACTGLSFNIAYREDPLTRTQYIDTSPIQ